MELYGNEEEALRILPEELKQVFIDRYIGEMHTADIVKKYKSSGSTLHKKYEAIEHILSSNGFVNCNLSKVKFKIKPPAQYDYSLLSFKDIEKIVAYGVRITNSIGKISEDSRHNLYVNCLELLNRYDPNYGITPGEYILNRIRYLIYEEIRNTNKDSNDHLSLNYDYKYDEETEETFSLEDVLEDANLQIAEDLVSKILYDDILDEVEKEFGLEGRDILTRFSYGEVQREIGKVYSMTPQAIKQKLDKMFSYIRNSKKFKDLNDNL